MLIEDDQLLSTITPKTTNFVINEKELYQEILLIAILLTKIFGTIMITGIHNKEFKFYLERCHLELRHSIQFPMQMHTPDIAVIHGGCNDISPRQNQEKLTEEEIKEIISIGSYCRDKGVNIRQRSIS